MDKYLTLPINVEVWNNEKNWLEHKGVSLAMAIVKPSGNVLIPEQDRK